MSDPKGLSEIIDGMGVASTSEDSPEIIDPKLVPGSPEWGRLVIDYLTTNSVIIVNGKWVRLPDKRICTTCHGLGTITEVNQPTRRCPNPNCPATDRQTRDRAKMLMSKSGIGRHYADFTFKTWQQQVIANKLGIGKELPFYISLEVARRPLEAIKISEALRSAGIDFKPVEREGVLYLKIPNREKALLVPEAQGRSLIFSGDFGVGKTGLAVALLNELMRQGVMVSAVKMMQFIRDIRATWAMNYDGPSPEAIARPAQEAQYLLIDGMDVKVDSGGAQSNRREIVHEWLVNPRYESDTPRPFIVTTNKGKQGFRDHWGEDICTRLFRDALWIPFEGQRVRRDATEIRMIEE